MSIFNYFKIQFHKISFSFSREKTLEAKSFNEVDYLNANPDVAMSISQKHFKNGKEHYFLFGKKEGRKFVPALSREEKALQALDKNGNGIEIGPSYNPLAPKKKGFKVQTVDHLSAEDLRTKYTGHGVDMDNIEEVDFIWEGQPLSDLLGKTSYYDWIIASHVIEHIPDPISFLQQCEAILKPGGILSLVIPDKRYCFDHFLPLTTTGNWLEAWAAKRIKPTSGQVFDFIVNSSKRDGNIAWVSDGKGPDSMAHTLEQAAAEWLDSNNSKEYIDVHCWRFMPLSFHLLLSDLQGLKMTTLGIKLEFDTTGCEFHVSLEKGIEYNIEDRLEVLKEIKKSE